MSPRVQSDDLFSVRDIRRYPTDLDGVRGGSPILHSGAMARPSYARIAAEAVSESPAASGPAPKLESGKSFSLWEGEDFRFADFIDIINPLHHIPIVATIYRNLSGDQIGAAPRVIGGAVWGRVGGFVAGLVNAAVEWWTGKDIGDHIYAAVFGPATEPSTSAAVVQAAPGEGAKSDNQSIVQRPSPTTHAESSASTGVPSEVPDPVGKTGQGSVAQPGRFSDDSAGVRHDGFSSYLKNSRWDESALKSRLRIPA